MACLATFAGSGVSQAVLGAMQDFIFDDMGWSRTTIAFAATSGTWCAALMSPLIGRFADRYGPRWLMPVGLLIGGTSFFFLAGIQAVWHFYAAYIVGRALGGQMLIGLVTRTTAVNFFRRKRNLALALTSTFRPVGVAINIMVMSIIATRYGWRASYHYLGVLSLFLVLPLLVFMRRRPEDIGLLPDGDRSTVATYSSPGRQVGNRGTAVQRSSEFSWTVREAFATRTLWFIIATSFLGTTASSSLGFSLKPYLVEVGLSQNHAAAVLSLGTVLAIVNVGWSFLADKFSPRYCLILALLMTATMNVYLITVNSLLTAYIFSVLWGLSARTIGSLEHMMLAQYYGRDSYGSMLGTLGPIQTFGLGLGPTLGALFRDAFGSYDYLYIVLFGFYLAAALCAFFAGIPPRPARSFTELVPDAELAPENPS